MAAPGTAHHRVPPNWGTPLTESDHLGLEISWITREIADAALLRRVDAAEGRQIVGKKGNRDCAGILLPYYWPNESHPHTYRIRRDNPELEAGKDGRPKPIAKYLGAPGGANRLYIPPGVTLERLADARVPITLVEGEKKALALWRLANHEVDSPRFIPIAIAGVWNWRGKIGRTGGPNGGWLDVKGPIPDLARIEWKGRTVFVVFDTNVHSNESVKWARKGLARELGLREAQVKFVNLPEDCGANGVDDLLAKWGPVRVLELFDGAVSGARVDIVVPPQYREGPDGLLRISGRGDRLTQYHLTNFNARIVTNICLDDGVEASRHLEIEAELHGSRHRFTISASAFAAMNWPIEQLGAAAIVHPNQKDYARTAIQALSLAAAEQRVYTHTGWRKVDGVWIYLHAGGAIGSAGAVTGVNVRLSGALARYEFQLPATADALRLAVRASLSLLEIGPPPISFSLTAATYRAVLGEADFSVHATGETGAFKSELVALYQQHFGPTMDRRNLPGAWSSTANALEMSAFYAKDAVFVIDDFAPQGGIVEQGRLHAVAERIFRAAGNHAGRGRLDSNAQLREVKPPRGLTLSTGEEIPRGQSIRSRLWILEVTKGAIGSARLTECQGEAREGLYAQAMAGFVRWLAPRYEEVRSGLIATVQEYRAESFGGAHARTPEIVANLRAAFDLFLAYATDVGAIDAAAANNLADRCRSALGEAARAQAKHQGETEPVSRFMALLQSVLSSGQAHLETRMGGMPDGLEKPCGWRREGTNWQALGNCVGWLDSDDLYLDITAAYLAVQKATGNSGEAFPISEATLKKRLKDKKLLASVDERRQTLTVRRTIGGVSKDVLHLRRTTLLPDEIDDEPEGDR